MLYTEDNTLDRLFSRPTYVETVRQKLVVEPLGGPQNPEFYTDRFPDELYHKSPESHLIRFLHALLGPSGVGWLREETFKARLIFEQEGLELFDLDRFYGDPLKFGRIVEEVYEEDPRGILPRNKWDEIRKSDERYRARALDFLNGARAGNTPLGMRLVARSGLGHEVEIVENYRHLFDVHSDDPLGIPHQGRTRSINEMIVLPRKEFVQSEVQQITITGSPTAGTFVLRFNGQGSAPISFDANYWDVQEALEKTVGIGEGNVRVRGGPGPNNPWVVEFVGELGSLDVSALTAEASFTGGTIPNVIIQTITQGKSAADEAARIPAKDRHYLQSALDRIKPVNVIPTEGSAEGLQTQREWNTVHASSEYNEVVRYVTGNPKVSWPTVDATNWIEAGIEKEARRASDDRRYHYIGFHTPQAIYAYTDLALDDPGYGDSLAAATQHASSHIGRFNGPQRALPAFAYLRENADDHLRYGPDRIPADYAEPLTVTRDANQAQLINGIYPVQYGSLNGVPAITYKEEQFWASLERTAGVEYVEIDLGSAQAVNFLSFEVSRKPLKITVDYDILDQRERRSFIPVTPTWAFNNYVGYVPQEQNPWFLAEYHFEDAAGRIPLTRYVRIGLARQSFPAMGGGSWSVEIRNLRVGRNVTSY